MIGAVEVPPRGEPLRRQRWGAVTVPVTAMWSGEQEARAPRRVMLRCGRRRLAMLSEGVDRPGEGKPLFKLLHADRCRAVIGLGLCQMCCEPLPPVVVTANQGQTDTLRPLISDGLPMCPACALEAYRACPGMQRQHQEDMLRLWESPRGAWLVAPVMLGEVPPSGGGDERVNALVRAAGAEGFWTGPKLVLTAWRRTTPAEL